MEVYATAAAQITVSLREPGPSPIVINVLLIYGPGSQAAANNLNHWRLCLLLYLVTPILMFLCCGLRCSQVLRSMTILPLDDCSMYYDYAVYQ
jgi:hypothetical protein